MVEREKSSRALAASAVSFYLLAYILPLGFNMPLVSPDETRYAEIAREMIESGDWVVPRLLGIDYYEKPILGYWLNALSELAFGYDDFAVRFPSALSAGLTALLISLFARRHFRGAAIGPLSGFVYLGFGLVYGVGTFSVLDSQLTLFASGSWMSFFLAYDSRTRRGRTAWLAACGALAGCAFLTKGPVAFALLAVSIAPFLAWQGEWKKGLTLPWIPLFASALVSLPWALCVRERAPDFWRQFLVVEHFDRFLRPESNHSRFHGEPAWYFLPVIAIGMLPWSLHVPAAVRGLWNREALRSPAVRFLISWAIAPVLFLSASGGKLATYVLPCFPALAMLMAYGIREALEAHRGEKAFALSAGFLRWTCLAAFAGILAYQGAGCLIPGLSWRYSSWVGTGLAALCLFVMAGLLRRSASSRIAEHRLALFGLAPLLALILRGAMVPEGVLEDSAQGQFIEEAAPAIGPDTAIVAHRNMMHAVAWYLRRSDIYLWDHPGELEYGTSLPKFRGRLLQGRNALQALIDEKRGKGGVATFMSGDFREGFPEAASREAYEDTLMFGKFGE
jgi:4-amino-4-deoxy-L-arabinose transferase